MKPKKISAALAAAFSSGQLVEMLHAPEPERQFAGYVVELNHEFAAIHAVDDAFMSLNGYTVFPMREVTAARPLTENSSFCQRALSLKGIGPARPMNISIVDFAELLSSIDAHFPLVTIHTGHLHPDECYIGRVAKLTGKSITLREINPSAQWRRVEKYRFRDITRIDFAGAYEDALWRVSENERSLAEKVQGTE